MNRKMELKRLIIYLIVTFAITWACFFAYILNGFMWDEENPVTTLVALGMLAPFAGNLITRWITNEGFSMTGEDSLMLVISFKNKRWIFYVAAMLLPWLYFELAELLEIIIYPQAFDLQNYKNSGMDIGVCLLFPVYAIVQSSILSFAALGEEGGWRGYMMPKLIKLFGFKRAVLLGGLIWGIWHAPITCIGHNFGTDYPGFPYVGILIMCLLCIFMNIILTIITLKTGSIWPAAILHAVNNSGPTVLRFFVNEDIISELMPTTLITWLFLLIGVAAASAGFSFFYKKH